MILMKGEGVGEGGQVPACVAGASIKGDDSPESAVATGASAPVAFFTLAPPALTAAAAFEQSSV